jgi:hypothetical protein
MSSLPTPAPDPDPPLPGAMTDRVKAAFTSAADLAKQLLTLGTAVLGVTLTFSKDLIDRIPEGERYRLERAWFLLALSLLAGTWGLMALTGALGSASKVADDDLSVYRNSIRIPFTLQIALFVLGVAFLIWAGSAAVDVASPPDVQSN